MALHDVVLELEPIALIAAAEAMVHACVSLYVERVHIGVLVVVGLKAQGTVTQGEVRIIILVLDLVVL